MRTLAVGLQNFRTDAGEIYNLLMAASTFSMISSHIVLVFTTVFCGGNIKNWTERVSKFTLMGCVKRAFH